LKVITYSLIDSSGNSNNYYTCVRDFTDKVIEKANNSIGDLIKEFEFYIQETGVKPERVGYEFIVEVLVLGVSWKVYGEKSINSNSLLRLLLVEISKLRHKFHGLKPTLDFMKGYLLTFLFYHKPKKEKAIIPTINQLKKLLLCLEAFGDFEFEAKRLKDWVEFLSGLQTDKAYRHLLNLMEFANWFEAKAQKSLQKYTGNVDSFIKQKYKFYRWREDVVFCLRKPVEYHLNMVGAELMSREYKKDFVNVSPKMVFLPACMRSHPQGQCLAYSGKLGLICAKCTPDCIANKITCLGEKNGYEVYLISHESSAFLGKDSCGVVGVSCVTRLIEGGFMAKELGFVPQCVLLDYCGCKNHWDENGIPTSLNLSELNKIMRYEVGCKDN
jgi:hypothetical protein